MNDLFAAVKFFVSILLIYAFVLIGAGVIGYTTASMFRSDAAGVMAIRFVGTLGIVAVIHRSMVLWHEIGSS